MPNEAEIAQDCAIHDRISSRDYKPETDEAGELSNVEPLPEYRVSDLVCEFVGTEKNRATCTFGLALPGEAIGTRESQTKLVYRRWFDITPLTYVHGMRWAIENDCTPSGP